MGLRLHLDRDCWSCHQPTMRAFLCEVDATVSAGAFSEDVLAGDGVRGYVRHRFARPTTVAWTLLEDGDAESIRSAVATGHHDVACGLLLNRAIELLSIAAAMPETTLPADSPTSCSSGLLTCHENRRRQGVTDQNSMISPCGQSGGVGASGTALCSPTPRSWRICDPCRPTAGSDAACTGRARDRPGSALRRHHGRTTAP